MSLRKTRVQEKLPEGHTLSDIRKILPKEVFEKSNWKAMKCLLTSVIFSVLGVYLISISPWYLLPLAWFFTGTAWTGLFVIGHDCGHRSFMDSALACDVIGTACFLPLVYPFEPWRIQHNHHHKYTNMLHIDNAWQPFQSDDYKQASPLLKAIFILVKGPLWFIASVGHQIQIHFATENFEKEDRPRVKVSVYLVYLFMATVFPTIIYFCGVWGLLKYWAIPWIGYHFWMSTFTMVHHTATDIPFTQRKDWDPAVAQLSGTVHCDYPKWVEYLCHNINVHVPHHVSTQIPNYNLWDAHYALKSKYSKHMIHSVFGLRLLWDIISQCHLFHEEKNYVPFPVFEKAPLQ